MEGMEDLWSKWKCPWIEWKDPLSEISGRGGGYNCSRWQIKGILRKHKWRTV
jgi:hypothetical protein